MKITLFFLSLYLENKSSNPQKPKYIIMLILLAKCEFGRLFYFVKIKEFSKMWHDRGNESDVGNIDFELQDKRGDKFLCFTLFLKLKNCSYLRNHMSDWDGTWIKMYHFKWTSDLYWKIKIENCRHVTHSPWSCHKYDFP